MWQGSIRCGVFNHTEIDFGQDSKHNSTGNDFPPFGITCHVIFCLLPASHSVLSLYFICPFLSQIASPDLASEALTATCLSEEMPNVMIFSEMQSFFRTNRIHTVLKGASFSKRPIISEEQSIKYSHCLHDVSLLSQ